MTDRVTLSELESRWNAALRATQTAVADHAGAYRELKTLATKIISAPIDINDYFPTVTKMIDLLNVLDPCGNSSIFHFFKTRISPTNIWQVKMLRMECRDLLAYLHTFDEWRRNKHRMRIVK